MTIEHKLDLDRVATGIVSAFPALDFFEQRLSLELYRRLAERALLAERLGVAVEIADNVLNGWPGVFSDPEQNIVGYWGLSKPAWIGRSNLLGCAPRGRSLPLTSTR